MQAKSHFSLMVKVGNLGLDPCIYQNHPNMTRPDSVHFKHPLSIAVLTQLYNQALACYHIAKANIVLHAYCICAFLLQKNIYIYLCAKRIIF